MKFNVLVIDPPWQYRKRETGGSLKSGAAQKYNTLTIKQLEELKPYIDNVISENCVMYMWVTNPFIREGLDLVQFFGFEYKTMITWVKTNGIGLGYWHRGNTEHMLFATRGKVKPFRSKVKNEIHADEIEVIHEKRKGHSVKPTRAYELIDLATQNMQDRLVLELFARREWKDWVSVGDELSSKDIKESLKELI